MTKICAMFFVLAFGLKALAAGEMSFTLQDKYGFQKMQLTEMNGVRDGSFTAGLSQATARSYVKNNQLVMQMGSKTDVLEIRDIGGGSKLYRGFFDGTQPTEIQVWTQGARAYLVKGKVKEIEFKIEIDRLTKTLLMTWQNVELHIWGDMNPRRQNGSCKGEIGNVTDLGFDATGKFSCATNGSLKDSLFKNPEDVIANLVHLLISAE